MEIIPEFTLILALCPEKERYMKYVNDRAEFDQKQ